MHPLTNEPITTGNELLDTVDHDRARWTIEEYFKAPLPTKSLAYELSYAPRPTHQLLKSQRTRESANHQADARIDTKSCNRHRCRRVRVTLVASAEVAAARAMLRLADAAPPTTFALPMVVERHRVLLSMVSSRSLAP